MPIVIIQPVLFIIPPSLKLRRGVWILKKSPKKEGKSYFDRKLLGHIEKIPHGEIKGKALS